MFLNRNMQKLQLIKIEEKINHSFLHYKPIYTGQMIRKTSIMPTPILTRQQSSKAPFQDLNGTQMFAQESNFLKNQNLTKSILQKNRQKVQKRNVELIKLFKPTQHQQFNLTLLQNSSFMKNNEIFQYLVNRLKKQREGMINVKIQQESRKAPKIIENKIREFVCHSLHEALIIPDSELKQTRYFERLFTWFTDVFRQREMKLSFRIEKKDLQNKNAIDEDWLIRNNYKSNMPSELGHYQRRMINGNILTELGTYDETLKGKRRIVDFKRTFEEKYGHSSQIKDLNETGQQKLYTLPTMNTSSYTKSTELLPALNSHVYMSKLVRSREEKQMDQLKTYQQEWKKAKAQFQQNATKNYFETQKIKGKTLDNHSFLARQRSRKNKENSRPLSLEPKVLERIQAARLGVTCTEFRKNKENILKQNKSETYNSPVFHPLLTANYFSEIKKKRLQMTQKSSFPRLLKQNQARNSQESSEDMINMSNESDEIDLQQEKNCEMLFAERYDEDQHIDCIDGLGLSFVGEKKEKDKCKKNENK